MFGKGLIITDEPANIKGIMSTEVLHSFYSFVIYAEILMVGTVHQLWQRRGYQGDLGEYDR
jgi:hypothetical protein